MVLNASQWKHQCRISRTIKMVIHINCKAELVNCDEVNCFVLAVFVFHYPGTRWMSLEQLGGVL